MVSVAPVRVQEDPFAVMESCQKAMMVPHPFIWCGDQQINVRIEVGGTTCP